VTVGDGPEAFTAYLKREQRVRWRDRLASALAGFGLVSRSCREARLLRQLECEGVAAPEVVASGEDGRGRAFLLVRALPGAVELRHFLSDRRLSPRQRRAVAGRLGRALAACHAAGFTHPDLYAKHILVRQDETGAIAFAFLDWMRAARRRRLSAARCCRDLAALDATLADELATARERLLCLRAYCRVRTAFVPAWAAPLIRRHALRLLRRRRLGELRQPPLPAGRQQLVRVDALCLNREFRDALQGKMPRWLTLPGEATDTVVPVAPARQAALVRRHVSRPLRWLWGRLRGKPLLSAEVEHAGTLFRLERYGVRAPRLLAFGQRSPRPWRTESLLLTEVLADSVPPGAGLARQPSRERRRLLREAGALVRRMHEAACYLGDAADALRIQAPAGAPAQIVLAGVRAIRRRHRPSAGLASRDLATLRRGIGRAYSRTDALRFLLGYLDVPRLTPQARRLCGRPAVLRRVQS
jgi:tRNA A-37 threonylcarbamoyl transferase component Bud32